MTDTTTVRVPLTVEERAGKADEMARLVLLIEGIEADKAAYAKRRNDEIKEHQAELAAIANVVQQGAEDKAQMDLTFTQVEAAKALAGVGEAACSCEGGPEAEVKSATCPVHGLESRGENPAPCDGVHGQDVACQDPKCWLIEGPAEDPLGTDELAADLISHGVVAAEASADYVVAEVEHVEVEAPKEPAAITEFHKAKARRAKARA